MLEDIYKDGTYLAKNPGWHIDESPWKAKHISDMLMRHKLVPQTICEVGCGAGEVLKEVQKSMDEHCVLWGYDISPQAIDFCMPKANERLHFKLADIREEPDVHFDLILVMDVIEHLEDYFSFLRVLKSKSDYVILHVPLDLSIQGLLRVGGLLHVYNIYGHIHYFTKAIILRVLQDIGYEVLESRYTSRSIDLPTRLLGRNLLRLPRKLLFSIHQDVASRLLGGFGLLVLAK